MECLSLIKTWRAWKILVVWLQDDSWAVGREAEWETSCTCHKHWLLKYKTNTGAGVRFLRITGGSFRMLALNRKEPSNQVQAKRTHILYSCILQHSPGLGVSLRKKLIFIQYHKFAFNCHISINDKSKSDAQFRKLSTLWH